MTRANELLRHARKLKNAQNLLENGNDLNLFRYFSKDADNYINRDGHFERERPNPAHTFQVVSRGNNMSHFRQPGSIGFYNSISSAMVGSARYFSSGSDMPPHQPRNDISSQSESMLNEENKKLEQENKILREQLMEKMGSIIKSQNESLRELIVELEKQKNKKVSFDVAFNVALLAFLLYLLPK